MAGMISQAQQPAQPEQEQQPQEPQNPPQQQSVADSQEAYDLAAGQMLNFIYDEQGIQALTRLVQAAPDPSQGMARLFGRLLMMTAQSAAMAGKRVAPALVFQAGIEAIRAISEVAQAQDLIDKADEKEITEAAFYDGIALFATEAKEEALTQADREQYTLLLQKAEELEQKSKGSLPSQNQGQKQPEQPQEMTA